MSNSLLRSVKCNMTVNVKCSFDVRSVNSFRIGGEGEPEQIYSRSGVSL